MEVFEIYGLRPLHFPVPNESACEIPHKILYSESTRSNVHLAHNNHAIHIGKLKSTTIQDMMIKVSAFAFVVFLAGLELIFFIEAQTMLCFRFLMKTVLITY